MISRSLKPLNEVAIQLHNFQSVRYRKPIWMPRAKSKMFIVPPRPVIPYEEDKELQRLHNNYRTSIKSIRHYLASEWKEKTQETIDHEAEKKKFQDDFQKSLLLNQEWAEQLRPVRENFIADELKKKLFTALETMETKKLEKETHLEQVEDLVRQIKADSKHFITAENIDAAIDCALDNQADYNYALNLEGDKVVEFKK